MPVHSACCASVTASVAEDSGVSRLFASSNAALARVAVVVLIVSRTYSASPASQLVCPGGVGYIVDDAIVDVDEGEEEMAEDVEDENRGENQSPLKSKKQRSDQWQEERKRIRRRAEQ